jgi:hypothetical protein
MGFESEAGISTPERLLKNPADSDVNKSHYGSRAATVIRLASA